MCSCYDDSDLRETLQNHQAQLNELQTLCQTLNDDVQNLMVIIEAVSNADYITGITPVVEGGAEVGYTITFAKHGTVTIRFGKDGTDGADGKDGADGAPGEKGEKGDAGADGKDGEDGKDGVTPVIGVKEEDGVYYWTINGEFLVDDSDNRIPTCDGPAPQLKIEEGEWYVSYDYGVTWISLGAAANGNSCLFADVYQQDGMVYFVLSDGNTYSLPYVEDGVRSYYVDEIAKTTASVRKLLTEPCLVFPMVADIHYKASKDCPDLVDITLANMLALSKNIRFDFIVSLGDIVEGDTPQAQTEKLVEHIYERVLRIDAPYYPVIGNHDENWEHGTFSLQQLHGIYMRHTFDVMFDNTSMCGTNYYKDFYNLGVRCIFLNSINGGTFGFSEDTCNWFKEALDTPFDVYVFSHVSPIRSHQHDYWYHFNDAVIEEAIKAAPNFKMFFNGHSHFDCEFTAPFNDTPGRTYNPFLAYSLTCNKFINNEPGKNWPAHANQPSREIGTVTEDAFDIVVIRPKSGKVNTVRFGAGVDREFDLRTGESVGESAVAKFPAEMTVALDFGAGWPFEEGCAVSSEQRGGGESYLYYHEYTRADNGLTGKLGMNFRIQRSSAKKTDTNNIYYSHADGYLSFGDTAGDGTGGTYGMINIPGVPGRYVKSIKITHDGSAFFTVADGEWFVYDASPNASSSTSAGPTLFDIPYVKGTKTVPAKIGAPYNIRLRTAATKISRIEVTYSASEPGTL